MRPCRLFAAVALLAACGSPAAPAPLPPPSDAASAMPPDYGPNPVLPPPAAGGVPTIHVAEAVGWPAGAAPQAVAGFEVTAYARELEHPRRPYLLPNGDLLIAEATTRPGPVTDVTSLVANMLQKRAGALGPGTGRIILLRDADGDGDVDLRQVFLANLDRPFGMALVGDDFYVADTDAILRYDYTVGATSITTAGESVVRLPHGETSLGHWTRDLLASRDGAKLYVGVGSNSNIAEAGMGPEAERAAIWEVDLATGAHRVFASGLRNPNGLNWEPETGALWAVVNERDMLGDNLVPDYMTSVRDGGFYGWPYSYYGQHVDARVRPQNPDLVARAIAPDYALGAHTASLGLVFCTSDLFPERYRGGAFIAQHGSWNRSRYAGYKVIFVPFADGRPSGPPEDFLTGFIDAHGRAQGRPVGLSFDRTGALIVADDVGGIVWRVAPSAPQSGGGLSPPSR